MNKRKMLLNQIKAEEYNIEKQKLILLESKIYFIQLSKKHSLLTAFIVVLAGLLTFRQFYKSSFLQRLSLRIKPIAKLIFYQGLKRGLIYII